MDNTGNFIHRHEKFKVKQLYWRFSKDFHTVLEIFSLKSLLMKFKIISVSIYLSIIYPPTYLPTYLSSIYVPAYRDKILIIVITSKQHVPHKGKGQVNYSVSTVYLIYHLCVFKEVEMRLSNIQRK